MIYLPDTNACVAVMRNRSVECIRRFQQTLSTEIVLCDIVMAELWYGIYRSGRIAQNTQLLQRFVAPYQSLPFDGSTAQIFGELRHTLNASGTPIGPYDLQIAAIALHHGLVLVTHNTREFQRVPGLQLQDWEATPLP